MMPRELSWEEYDALAEGKSPHVLVDVREDDEWASGHIENSVHIPLGELAERAQELLPDTSALIIACCRSGARAAYACEELAGRGYRNLAYIVGNAGDRYRVV